VRHTEAEHPGELVQLHCICVDHLAGSQGRTWRDTAIDVASGH
jgi:hypothetical protein